MTDAAIRVLVVEDDPVAADAHALYVDRVPGFTAVGKARTAAEARRLLHRTPVDLILLDLYLPDGHGLELARSLRAAGHRTDVIAVTSARDLAVVREGVSLGVVQYVLKPFAFATLRDRSAGLRAVPGRGGRGRQPGRRRPCARHAAHTASPPSCPRGSARPRWRPSSARCGSRRTG